MNIILKRSLIAPACVQVLYTLLASFQRAAMIAGNLGLPSDVILGGSCDIRRHHAASCCPLMLLLSYPAGSSAHRLIVQFLRKPRNTFSAATNVNKRRTVPAVLFRESADTDILSYL